MMMAWKHRPAIFSWFAVLSCLALSAPRALAHQVSDASSETTTASSSSSSIDAPLSDDSIVFRHFIAHSANMTCSADEHAQPFNNQIRGVNLGGWLVLEPWITPSLFMQFLGGDTNTTAFDMYNFCQVLGPQEANKQLQRHWDTWLTEDIIKQLKESGDVNSLRLPIGDFMYVPYGPYTDGCVDGALERVELLLDWAYANGLTVLLDIHTMKDSQNGFDNSGQSMGFAWTSECTLRL
jgi:glucan 1,3-beta-glucosidase